MNGVIPTDCVTSTGAVKCTRFYSINTSRSVVLESSGENKLTAAYGFRKAADFLSDRVRVFCRDMKETVHQLGMDQSTEEELLTMVCRVSRDLEALPIKVHDYARHLEEMKR